MISDLIYNIPITSALSYSYASVQVHVFQKSQSAIFVHVCVIVCYKLGGSVKTQVNEYLEKENE